jgi:hypothetical protein
MRRKVQVLFDLGFLILFYGCASFRFKPIAYDPKHGMDQIKNYQVGEVRRVNVGESLVEFGNSNVIKNEGIVFKAIKDARTGGIWKLWGNNLDIVKEKLYPATHIANNQGSYLIFIGKYNNLLDQLNTHLEVDNQGNIIANRIYQNGVRQPYNFSSDIAEGEKVFEKLVVIEKKELEGSKKVELIYNGRESKVIKILYREFINDLARPAFYQNLTYTLDESNIIRYKNFKIEVFESTNEYITYKVIED